MVQEPREIGEFVHVVVAASRLHFAGPSDSCRKVFSDHAGQGPIGVKLQLERSRRDVIGGRITHCRD